MAIAKIRTDVDLLGVRVLNKNMKTIQILEMICPERRDGFSYSARKSLSVEGIEFCYNAMVTEKFVVKILGEIDLYYRDLLEVSYMKRDTIYTTRSGM